MTSPNDDEILINGHDCPHCGIWFKLDDAKPVVGRDAVRCPNCGWVIEKGVENIG